MNSGREEKEKKLFEKVREGENEKKDACAIRIVMEKEREGEREEGRESECWIAD